MSRRERIPTSLSPSSTGSRRIRAELKTLAATSSDASAWTVQTLVVMYFEHGESSQIVLIRIELEQVELSDKAHESIIRINQGQPGAIR